MLLSLATAWPSAGAAGLGPDLTERPGGGLAHLVARVARQRRGQCRGRRRALVADLAQCPGAHLAHLLVLVVLHALRERGCRLVGVELAQCPGSGEPHRRIGVLAQDLEQRGHGTERIHLAQRTSRRLPHHGVVVGQRARHRGHRAPIADATERPGGVGADAGRRILEAAT